MRALFAVVLLLGLGIAGFAPPIFSNVERFNCSKVALGRKNYQIKLR